MLGFDLIQLDHLTIKFFLSTTFLYFLLFFISRKKLRLLMSQKKQCEISVEAYRDHDTNATILTYNDTKEDIAKVRVIFIDAPQKIAYFNHTCPPKKIR